MKRLLLLLATGGLSEIVRLLRRQPPDTRTRLVREYKDNGEYEADAQRLAADGWQVVTATNREERPGLIRMILLHGGGLLWRPKPLLIVTYTRSLPTTEAA